MKCTEMRYAFGVVVLVLLLGGCSGGSSEGAVSVPEFVEPSDVPVETPEVVVAPSEVPTQTPEPTATAVPVSDADRVDAALAALGADGVDESLGLIAWDVLDSSVRGDVVTLSLCGWTGRDAFDSVYSSLWQVTGESGALVARDAGTAFDAGECLNTELVDSAFEFITEYEAYWTEMVRYPDRFENDPRSERLLTDIRLADAEAYLRRLVENGEYVDGLGLDGPPGETPVAPPLYRRYTDDDGERVLELALCRPMDEEFGTYSTSGVLVTDERIEGAGPHGVDAYVLQRSSDESRWLYSIRDPLRWADCTRDGDWPSAANSWRNRAVALAEVPRP